MTDHEVSRTSDGFVHKRYGHLEDDQPRREWRALQILHEYAPGLAPEPITADLDATPPWITMGVLAGDSLGDQPLSLPQMRAIVAALQRLHTCVPREALATVRSCNDPGKGLPNIAGELAAQRRPGDDAIVSRAFDEVLRWLSGAEANRFPSEDRGLMVFARGDHNLSNFLWDGDRVRLVDFEYAGKSDRCAEIAELIEHISARCTPDRTWDQLLDELDLSRFEGRRVLTIRRLDAIMWFRMLLPGQPGHSRNPPGTLQMQAQRLLDLLSA